MILDCDWSKVVISNNVSTNTHDCSLVGGGIVVRVIGHIFQIVINSFKYETVTKYKIYDIMNLFCFSDLQYNWLFTTFSCFSYFEYKIRLIRLGIFSKKQTNPVFELTTHRLSVRCHYYYTKGPTVSGRYRKP